MPQGLKPGFLHILDRNYIVFQTEQLKRSKTFSAHCYKININGAWKKKHKLEGGMHNKFWETSAKLNGWKNERLGSLINGWMDQWMDRWIEKVWTSGWWTVWPMDGWMNECTSGWMEGWMVWAMDGWVNQQMDQCIDRLMDRQNDKQTDEQMDGQLDK